MRKLSTACMAALFVFVVAGPAAAERAPTPRERPAGAHSGGPLADRDADRVSDGFEPKVDAAAPTDRFEVIVTFRPGSGGDADAARAQVGAFPVEQEFRIIPGFAGEMTAAQIRGLARNPNVHRIEEDIPLSAALDHSRADFGIERARTDFPGVTGDGIAVCVADTGVDPAHEQLDSHTIAWHDTTPDPSPTPIDPQGHGTHVASILLGDGTGSINAPAFRGVAPAADLFAARVLGADGSGEDSWIVAGIQWCVGQGVDVLS
ncbi:MAG: S8 family serine peptidase, partial [Actinomycetota bacterium]